MKAAVVVANEDVQYLEIPEPEAKPGYVKIKVHYSGICGSDIPRVLHNGVHFYPIVLGHEFSGDVVEIGEGVTKVKAGDRVSGAPLVPCMKCEGGAGFGYDIPAEALSDPQFAKMIREAEKYLGYPYVWGGASPSTSFDCSGFVCWVINNCGNGWNVGRTTADGLRSYCSYVSPSDAKPGDLIFFQGTYDTPGASHVGIYVGNNMMIHCGNPIQYTSIASSYWQQHFMAFGRLH